MEAHRKEQLDNETPNGEYAPPAQIATTSAARSIEWRAHVATLAHRFFSLPQDQTRAELADAPYQEGAISFWTIRHFSKYLAHHDVTGGDFRGIVKILGAMERAGLLLDRGWDYETPIMGKSYMSNRGETSQMLGSLWMSEVFGGALIIPCYRAVTVQIAGCSPENGDERSGTGLILDRSHVLTNAHVVRGMAGNLSIHAHGQPPLADGNPTSLACNVYAHPEIDVAVIQVQLHDHVNLPALEGMTFRDPSWDDETYLFGYPRVPTTAQACLTVQRGEVVNPLVESMFGRQKFFLYSATARPGNSGGPIVAQDGRVIGLVAESVEQSPSTDGGPVTTPFYSGVPSSEIVRALDDMGFGGIARVETWG